MPATEIALLGAIAGLTIYLGLPLGRLTAPMPRTRVLLNALAIGILVFLLWDVLAHAWEPIDSALSEHHFGSAVGNGLVFVVCFGIGLLGLVYFDLVTIKRQPAEPRKLGPGTTTVHEINQPATNKASRLALMIAIGIGLHNFGEGLAIGNSAASGQLQLAVLLIIGFGLHNATEGFGIVAPLAAEGDRPSWGFLLLMGLIGGGPTFVGTAVGRQFTSDAMSVIFLTLAAGSILYVVIQLLGVAYKNGRKELIYWGVLLGLCAGFVTDMVVTAGGA
jgi:ZIP family zinc transporter